MHKAIEISISALALVGAWRVANWMCEGTAWLLVNCGSWEYQAAADAAPWVLFALGSGLAMSLYGMYEENQQYKRSSPYGRIQNSERLNDDSRKAG